MIKTESLISIYDLSLFFRFRFENKNLINVFQEIKNVRTDEIQDLRYEYLVIYEEKENEATIPKT